MEKIRFIQQKEIADSFFQKARERIESPDTEFDNAALGISMNIEVKRPRKVCYRPVGKKTEFQRYNLKQEQF